MDSRMFRWIVALLLLGAATITPLQAQEPSATDKWQSVATTDSQEAFVNGSSIVAVDGQFEARVKQNFMQPQPSAKKGKAYLSSRTTYRFDCVQRRMAIKEVRTYSAADLQGESVQKATSTDKNLQWIDVQDGTVFGEVLDFVCTRSPAG
jgi:hypothetical protein